LGTVLQFELRNIKIGDNIGDSTNLCLAVNILLFLSQLRLTNVLLKLPSILYVHVVTYNKIVFNNRRIRFHILSRIQSDILISL